MAGFAVQNLVQIFGVHRNRGGAGFAAIDNRGHGTFHAQTARFILAAQNLLFPRLP